MNEIDDELEESAELLEESVEYIDKTTEPVEPIEPTEPIAMIEDIPNMTPAAEEKTTDEEPKKPFSDLIDWVACMVYAVALMLTINLFFFRSITVRGDSMNDTLLDNDQVIVTNFFYKPSYGDIVVVQANKLPVQGTDFYGEPIIKRVIAVAGDKVRINYEEGIVYRNDDPLDEDDYTKERTHLHGFGYMENNKEYTVPENCVFVMGDNRNNSNDSRNLKDLGFIDVDMIIGKAVVRFWPIKDFKWL